MIRELYHSIIQGMDLPDENNKRMKQEILDLLKEEEKRLQSQEYETYREKVFLAASVAEESGFERGFRYAFRLFAECIRD